MYHKFVENKFIVGALDLPSILPNSMGVYDFNSNRLDLYDYENKYVTYCKTGGLNWT